MKGLTIDEMELRAVEIDSKLPRLYRCFTGERHVYDPLMPERLLRFAMTGKSRSAFAGLMLVSRQTLYNWREMHPEFREAWEIFEYVRQNVLEEQLLAAQKSGPVVARLRALSRVDGRTWGDKKEVVIGGEKVDREVDPEKAYLFMLNGEAEGGGAD